jgi:hypothetical protein
LQTDLAKMNRRFEKWGKRCAARSASWSRRDLNFFDVAGTIAVI